MLCMVNTMQCSSLNKMYDEFCFSECPPQNLSNFCLEAFAQRGRLSLACWEKSQDRSINWVKQYIALQLQLGQHGIIISFAILILCTCIFFSFPCTPSVTLFGFQIIFGCHISHNWGLQNLDFFTRIYENL